MKFVPVFLHGVFRFGAADERNAEPVRDGGLGQVVRGGAEPAGSEDDIGAGERIVESSPDIGVAVGNFEREFRNDAVFEQFFSEKSEICVDGGPLQQFIADAEQCDFHDNLLIWKQARLRSGVPPRGRGIFQVLRRRDPAERKSFCRDARRPSRTVLESGNGPSCSGPSRNCS